VILYLWKNYKPTSYRGDREERSQGDNRWGAEINRLVLKGKKIGPKLEQELACIAHA